MSGEDYTTGIEWWHGMHMYWHEKQVVVGFHSDVRYEPIKTSSEAIASLKLGALYEFLAVRGLQLKSFAPQQTARPTIKPLSGKDNNRDAYNQAGSQMNGHHGEWSDGGDDYGTAIERDLHVMTGKYLFPSHTGSGTLVIGFFNVESVDTGYPILESGEMFTGDQSVTRRAVRTLNSNLKRLRDEGGVSILFAAPNWLGGGSALGCTTTGGPASPPYPILDEDPCANQGGLWPIRVPAVEASPLVDYKGAGVTVFVLDTMPGEVRPPGEQTPSQVSNAEVEATTHNRLLAQLKLQMDEGEQPDPVAPYVKIHYQDLPTMNDGNFVLGTGWDINGQPYGYPMPDHGLFVTGIVRDIAPEANIEFVRVLDDYGVGSTDTVIAALSAIQQRIYYQHTQSVVVNLSLLVSPPAELLPALWLGPNTSSTATQLYQVMEDLSLLHAPLHSVIRSLAGAGAVIIAAAGNQSNRATIPAGMPTRLGPAYPAAYPEVIAVGAVDRQGNAASYSNYPQSSTQLHGLASYGGAALTAGELNTHQDIDAVRGIFSAPTYPALQPQGTIPAAPQPNTHWAYWSGTSFATPIVSAVAARVLQYKLSQFQANNTPPGLRSIEIQRLLTTALGQQELFGTMLAIQPELGVSLLMAEQDCQSQGPGAAPARPYDSVGA